jgi:hypothetical protein
MPGANVRSTVAVLLRQDYNADGRLRVGSTAGRLDPDSRSYTLQTVSIPTYYRVLAEIPILRQFVFSNKISNTRNYLFIKSKLFNKHFRNTCDYSYII